MAIVCRSIKATLITSRSGLDSRLILMMQGDKSSKATDLGVSGALWSMPPIRLGLYKILEATALVALSIGSGCQIHNSSAMGGTWLFTIASGTSAPLILTANLQQHGNQITGQASVAENNSSCGSATITGSLQGNALDLEIVQLQSELFLVGTVNPTFTHASGTYTSSGSANCFQTGDWGSWSAYFGRGG